MFVVSFCVTGLMNLNDHSAGMFVHVPFFPVKRALAAYLVCTRSLQVVVRT